MKVNFGISQIVKLSAYYHAPSEIIDCFVDLIGSDDPVSLLNIIVFFSSSSNLNQLLKICVDQDEAIILECTQRKQVHPKTVFYDFITSSQNSLTLIKKLIEKFFSNNEHRLAPLVVQLVHQNPSMKNVVFEEWKKSITKEADEKTLSLRIQVLKKCLEISKIEDFKSLAGHFELLFSHQGMQFVDDWIDAFKSLDLALQMELYKGLTNQVFQKDTHKEFINFLVIFEEESFQSQPQNKLNPLVTHLSDLFLGQKENA